MEISKWKPLLATIDVEVAHDRDLDAQKEALWRLYSDFRRVPLTWFCTAEAAERFAEPLRALVREGHSVGCHGIDHGVWEDYRNLSYSAAFEAINEATGRIAAALGVRPRIFRGPRMTTSSSTQRALQKLGYVADFSVCSRRWDFLAASRFSWRWPGVPNGAYVPSSECPFEVAAPARRDKFVVVPLSGFGLPLCSGTLYLLGENAALNLAARVNRDRGSALVYLFHSYEFCEMSKALDHRPLHHRLYPKDPESRYSRNRLFLTNLQMRGARPIAAIPFIEGNTDG